jgi:hypothetical protein
VSTGDVTLRDNDPLAAEFVSFDREGLFKIAHSMLQLWHAGADSGAALAGSERRLGLGSERRRLRGAMGLVTVENETAGPV